MSENTNTPDVTSTEDTDLADQPVVATEFATKEEFEKGSWQHTVQQSSVLFKRSGDAKKRASVMLWNGSTAAIAEWEANSDTDVNGEGLYADLLIIMGTARKGDVSKIKTVALAVRNNGLDTGQFPNLSKAYAEAIRLTKTAKVEAEEDTAGDEAIAAVAADAPKTASTVESGIKMALALAQDFDEFFKVMLDVVNHGGDENVAAHRAALRSLAQEVSGRAKPAAPAPTQGGDKAGASAATGPATTESATKAPAKAKPAGKPTPTSVSKGDPNAKALPPKTKPVPVETAPVEDAGDIFSETDAEDGVVEAPATPAPTKKATPAKPRRA